MLRCVRVYDADGAEAETDPTGLRGGAVQLEPLG